MADNKGSRKAPLHLRAGKEGFGGMLPQKKIEI